MRVNSHETPHVLEAGGGVPSPFLLLDGDVGLVDVASAPVRKPLVSSKTHKGSRAVGAAAILQRVCDESASDGVELPNLRFDIAEAARILRFCRATLYNRISEGTIRTQKDGRRTYITRAELERYVASRG
jgi:excisionase family DNA binding protein